MYTRLPSDCVEVLREAISSLGKQRVKRLIGYQRLHRLLNGEKVQEPTLKRLIPRIKKLSVVTQMAEGGKVESISEEAKRPDLPAIKPIDDMTKKLEKSIESLKMVAKVLDECNSEVQKIYHRMAAHVGKLAALKRDMVNLLD